MKRFVRSGLIVATLACLAACSRSPENSASADAAAKTDKPTPMIVQLDWVAEPEHGGFYQAQARGFFREAGLDVTLIPGGPNAFVMQKVATAQAHVGQADSTNTLVAIHEGLPVIQVGAVFQNDPSVLMLHADNPVDSFEELDGKTIMARPGWVFLAYLKHKYGIDFNVIPQNFSVANFIADRNFIQHGYYIAEPYHIEKGGAKPPKFLYAWDAGFDAYTVLIANRPWARAHPDEMRAFMAAYIRGWQDYLQGDPSPAHELMKRANPNNTDEFLAFSRGMILSERLVTGRGPEDGEHQIGRISRERFATQIRQLEELDLLPEAALKVEQVMTTDYLP